MMKNVPAHGEGYGGRSWNKINLRLSWRNRWYGSTVRIRVPVKKGWNSFCFLLDKSFKTRMTVSRFGQRKCFPAGIMWCFPCRERKKSRNASLSAIWIPSRQAVDGRKTHFPGRSGEIGCTVGVPAIWNPGLPVRCPHFKVRRSIFGMEIWPVGPWRWLVR